MFVLFPGLIWKGALPSNPAADVSKIRIEGIPTFLPSGRHSFKQANLFYTAHSLGRLDTTYILEDERRQPPEVSRLSRPSLTVNVLWRR